MFILGAIGAGHMGMTVLDAAVKAGIAASNDVLIYELNPERIRQARSRGFSVAGSICETYANAQYLMLAVPPQEHIVDPLLSRLSRCVTEHKPVIISIMAGISSSYIQNFLGEQTAVICIMPTIGIAVDHGAAAISHTSNVPDSALSDVIRIFTSCGEAVVVDEPLLKEVVAANGCSPGYAFYLMDAIAKAAAEQGVDYDMAVRMVANGFAGAARLALTSRDSLPFLLSQVCTTGGLTAKGIEKFNQKRVAEHIAEGVRASIARGYSLAK